MPTLLDCYYTVYRALKQAEVLEKHASTQRDDVLELKSSQALDVLQFLKEASKGEIAKQLVDRIPEGVRKGLLYGTGAMIPVTAGGALLAHRGGEEARDTATHIRNQALLAALGIGGVGAGLMGVHRVLTPKERSRKTAALHDADETLIEKLATVGYLDTILAVQEKHGANAAIRQDAFECRRLNAEHGLDILQQMLT